jgi:hypothetical protein
MGRVRGLAVLTAAARRAAIGLVVAAAATAFLAAPAAAADSATKIARALERSPVYAPEAALTAAERASIEAAIRRAPEPVFVALVDKDRLPAIAKRLGRPGVYVTAGDGGVDQVTVGVDEERSFQAALVVNHQSAVLEPPSATLPRFLRWLSDPRLPERYRQVTEELRGGGATPVAPGQVREADDGGVPWPVVGGVAALLALVLIGLLVAWRRGGAQVAAKRPPVLPERVFEHARTSAERELRESIETQVVAFAEALDETSAPEDEAAQESYQRALDSYSAARKALDEASGTPDLAGSLVLIDRGRAALAGARPQPICFFNPLHGHALRPVAWKDDERVPACRECSTAVRGGEAPDALLDDGRPYFERDGVWARTGYGAFSDDLVERVLRGELRARA